MSKSLLVGLVILIAGLFVGIVLLHDRREPVVEIARSSSENVGKIASIERSIELQEFIALTYDGQMERLRLLDLRGLISGPERRLLQDIVRDKSSRSEIRNNAANVLICTREKDLDLPGMFIEMAFDPNETLTWREHALQHLSHCLEFAYADDRVRGIRCLEHFAASASSMLSGTALLKLHQLSQSDAVIWNSNLDSTIEQKLDVRPIDTRLHTTLLGIVEDRENLRHYDSVKRIYFDSDSPMVKGCVLRVLAKIGSEKDLHIFEKAQQQENKNLSQIARVLKGKLRKIDKLSN